MGLKMKYFDNASTTWVYPECIEIINDILKNCWGNPSNIYDFGLKANEIVEASRKTIADTLKVLPEEIIFVSSASEGNAFALSQGNSVFVSPYEHHDILDNPKCKVVKESFEYNWGAPPLSLVRSHMWVNNETGQIFDIDNIFKKAKKGCMLTHCDATQALGNIEVYPHDHPDVDIMTFGGHKIHAPKGQSFMYVKKEVQDKLKPLIYGSQENHLRGSTENVHQIAALALAVERSCDPVNIRSKIFTTCVMKEVLIKVLNNFKLDYIINRGDNNCASTLNISFKGINGDALVLFLNKKGFSVSTGSACNTGNLSPSTVLTEMGVSEDYIYGTIRISFDPSLNSTEDVKELGEAIAEGVKSLNF